MEKRKRNNFSILFILILFLLLINNCSTTSSTVKSDTAISNNKKSNNNEKDPVMEIINTIHKNLSKLPGRRIAVFYFRDVDGSTNVYGKILAEEIIAKLSEDKEIQVVERNNLREVLQEQELSAAGLTTNNMEIGNLANADAILTGTIVKINNEEDINAKLISSKNGIIICAINIKRHYNKPELKYLPPEKRKLFQEALSRENKNVNPELQKIMINYRRKLLTLRKRKPELYKRVVSTILYLNRIKNHNPRLFLFITTPPQQINKRRLNLLKRRDPQKFNQFMRIRKMIAFIVKYAPAYKKKLRFDRLEVEQRLKRN